MDTTPLPLAERRSTTTTTHGDTRIDEYSWLRDKEDPGTLAYLEAENEHTETTLAHLADLREQLFAEMKARIVETDLSVPVRRGGWWYYARTEEGKNYPIHCRRPAGPSDEIVPLDPPPAGEEIVLLDENEEAGGDDFFNVGILSVSPDHSTLAVAIDRLGDERYRLEFRSLTDGTRSTEVIEDVAYGFAWSNDSATVFYTRVDEAWRPHQVWRHEIGSPADRDELVLQEDDARFNVGLGKSRDQTWIVVSVASSSTSETWGIDATSPSSQPMLLSPRLQGVEHGLEHVTEASGRRRWLRVINDAGALDFRVEVADDEGVPPTTWSTVLPHRAGVRIEDLDHFAGCLVVSERADAETRLRIFDMAEGSLDTVLDLESSWVVEAERPPATTWLGANPEHTTTRLRFGQTSMVTPSAVCEIDVTTRAVTVLKRQEVLGGYDPTAYVTYRDWAVADDGTRIPVTLVHSRSLLAQGGAAGDPPALPAPCLLYGYGSYEASMDPSFSPFRLSLLDRGVIFAIAHVRGGGEMGRRWYDEGHLAHKQNSFSDFAAVAEHLIDRKITETARLAGRGGSAGGLLIGAVANQHPELFCALLAEVPFVDALNSILDPSLPLTVGEYEEWGNPTDDPAAYATIKAYAPYENVRSTDPSGEPFTYPPMLLTGGLNDTRVGFWEPAKLCARLRHANPANPILLRIEMGAGHGGPSGRYDAWREEAFVLAWLLEQLDATAPVSS